jgi:hypothetical protein
MPAEISAGERIVKLRLLIFQQAVHFTHFVLAPGHEPSLP